MGKERSRVKKVVWLLAGVGLVEGLGSPLAPVWANPQPWSVGPGAMAQRGAIAANPCPADPLLPSNAADPLLCAGAPGDDSLEQVRSVEELQDVQPSDWAYQALQSLVEKYGVIVGTPDRRFGGNRPLTRDEFAAALSGVMQRIEQLFNTGDYAELRKDFATIKRLQASYGKNLTTVGDRIQALEAAVAKLEGQQFSTTTTLRGQAVFGLTDGTNARASVVARVRLDLDTSFTGTDLLKTQLEAGNNGGDAIDLWQRTRGPNALGTEGSLADGGGLDFAGVPSTLRLSKLHYSFNPAANVRVTVGPQINPRDFIDQNQFANDSLENFSSSFFMNNPLIVPNQIDRPGGAGAVVQWRLGENSPFTVRGLYVAADGAEPNGGDRGGLFGDRNQGSVEVEYAVSKTLITRWQYTAATVNGMAINAGGLNVEWLLNRQIAFFGRLGLGSYKGFNRLLDREVDFSPLSWATGVTVRDIGIPGSVAGLAIGQPFVEGDFGEATQFNLEGYYRFQLNDRVSVSPALLMVANPNNRSTGTVFEWIMRMVYQF